MQQEYLIVSDLAGFSKSASPREQTSFQTGNELLYGAGISNFPDNILNP